MACRQTSKISTVITTYNRRNKVLKSIRSALAELPDREIVVVDDASTDDTCALLNDIFKEEIVAGLIKVVALSLNVGVTGAKNAGYAHASGDWVIFLDSDDEYLPAAGATVSVEIEAHQNSPIVFFRCIHGDGRAVGTVFEKGFDVDLARYLEKSSEGEVLTAVNKKLVESPPYIPELRGFEGLGCARLIRDHGDAFMSHHAARLYDDSGKDRLSGLGMMIRRSRLLGRGHLRTVSELARYMSLKNAALTLTKGLIYIIISLPVNFVPGMRK